MGFSGDLLITGGSGSFGNALIKRLLADEGNGPRRIIIYSRDEYKQWEMRRRTKDPDLRLRFFLGDVRDLPRLRAAFRGVKTVIHAAALKQVDAGEYNPLEFKKTNVDGAANVIDAAIHCDVHKVVALSTDKCCGPVNLYGATKLVAEKLFVSANALSGAGGTMFSCVRYGNVTGSRGSVVPLWREALAKGEPLSVTDPAMTRYWMTLGQAVDFVERCLEAMQGGEVFVPELAAYRLGRLATAMAGDGTKTKAMGIRPGEKIHESLISPDEAHTAWRWEHGYALVPWPTVDLAVPVPKGAKAAGLGGRGLCSADARQMTVAELREGLADVP